MQKHVQESSRQGSVVVLLLRAVLCLLLSLQAGRVCLHFPVLVSLEHRPPQVPHDGRPPHGPVGLGPAAEARRSQELRPPLC